MQRLEELASSRPLSPRRERQARNTFSTISQSSSVMPVSMVGENAYRISVAVAGFTEADLSIEAKENRLTIRGEKQVEEKTGNLLYQGIAARTFERSFQLADHVTVKGASSENGLLHVDLVREIPEAMKARTVPIASSNKLLESKPAELAA